MFRRGGPSPLAAVGSGSGWTVGPFSHSPQAIGVRIQPQAEAASAQTFRGTCPFHPDSQWEETIKLVFAMDFHGGPVVRNTGDAVLIPGHGIKIPQATWCGQKSEPLKTMNHYMHT